MPAAWSLGRKQNRSIIPSLFIPDRYVHSDYAGGEGRAVVGLEVTGGSFHVVEAQIEQGEVAEGDEDVGEVGQVPEGGQIHTGDVGDYAEGDDHQAQDRITLINAFFWEMRLAQISVKDMKPIRQVKAKRPKHRVTSRVTALLKAVPESARRRRPGTEGACPSRTRRRRRW